MRMFWKIVIAAIVFILVAYFGIGSLCAAWGAHMDIPGYSTRIQVAFEEWGEYIIRPVAIYKSNFNGGPTQTGFWCLTALFLIGYVFIIGKATQRERENSHDYAGSEHGSSDWAKNGEEYKVLNRREGFILSRKHYLGLDKRNPLNKNILVYGGSGTGKTAGFIKPNILQMLGSYVITDPKGELYRETSKLLQANGYDIKVLNLVDTKYSNRYNPLAHIRDYSDVDIIAHTIVEGGEGDGGGKSSDPFWDNTAKMLLKACIYYVISVLPPEERNLSSCLNIVRAGGADESIFDKLFVGGLKPEHPGRKEYEGIRVGADKTKQSIAISLVSKLSHFDSPSMQRLTTSDDISFEDIGRKKTAVYVISPDSHSTYNYILTIFYGQLLQRLYAEADANGGALKMPAFLLLDEFANIGKIPDFNQKLSTSRSRLISMSIIVQSLDQLVDLYKDLHENIISNCDTQIFMGSQSIKTCEYISKSLGQKTLVYQSKSKNRDKDDSTTQGYTYGEQRQGRELMTVDELKRLSYNEEIILVRGVKPIKAQKAWYYKYHPLKNKLEEYKIHDNSEMPLLPEVPVCVVDVQKHLDDRMNRARKLSTTSTTSSGGGKGEFELDITEEQNKENRMAQVANSENSNVNPVVSDSNNIVIDTNVSSSAINNLDVQVEELDLEKELERKFDELFGKNSSVDD